jgi:hypothetical protein
MTTRILILLLLLGCGKIEQIQDKFVALSVNNNLTQVDVRMGFLIRSTSSLINEDVVEFENTQYRVATVSQSAQSTYQSLPRGQRIPIYFKGNFIKRSGIVSSNPNLVVDAIEIESITNR